MKVLVPLSLVLLSSAALAAPQSDPDLFFDVITKVEKSLPLNVKRINTITQLPVRNWSAGQVRSADSTSGPVLRVEGGLDEKAQLTSVSIMAGAKTAISPEALQARFGKWTGQREKPIASTGNPKPIVYFYERPWGDMDFEFAGETAPPALKTVTIVPYNREKASGLSRRSKLSTPSK